MYTSLKKYLKQIPVEFLVIFPAFFILTLSTIFFLQRDTEVKAFLYANQIKYTLLMMVLFLCFCLIPLIISKLLKQHNKYGDKLYISIYAIAGLIAVFIFSLNWINSTLTIYSLAGVEYTKLMTVYHGHLDTFLGIQNWLEVAVPYVNQHPLLFKYIEITYIYLLHVITLVVLAILTISTRIGRKYITALSIAIITSAPLWLIFPTIAPAQIAIGTSFESFEEAEEVSLFTDIRILYEEQENTAWAQQLSEIVLFWDKITEDGFGLTVSNNPSTHVSWGVIFIWYLFKTRKYLGFIFLPLLIGEVIGTIFFAQHYLVDILTGALVATFAIFVAEKLFLFEDKHMQVKEEYWYAYFYKLKKLWNLMLSSLLQKARTLRKIFKKYYT